jgi:hypothetical protein
MNPWYSEQGRKVLQETEYGKLLFVWQALLDDGSVVEQFESHIMMRVVKDPRFIPLMTLAISTSTLDRSRVKKFTLTPTAYANVFTPWFKDPIECNIRLDQGEKFICNWLTDENLTLGIKISRTVIGIETKSGERFLTVLSPSGKVTLGSTTNMSYEGE